MAKRYYISKIVGDGTEGNAFRAKVEDYGVQYSAEIQSDPVTGLPLKDWCLCVVAAKDHSQLRKDADIDPLPDFPMDGKVSSIHTNTKNDMVNKLKKRNINTAFLASTDGYREVIKEVGKQLNPNFDENALDVADV